MRRTRETSFESFLPGGLRGNRLADAVVFLWVFQVLLFSSLLFEERALGSERQCQLPFSFHSGGRPPKSEVRPSGLTPEADVPDSASASLISFSGRTVRLTFFSGPVQKRLAIMKDHVMPTEIDEAVLRPGGKQVLIIYGGRAYVLNAVDGRALYTLPTTARFQNALYSPRGDLLATVNERNVLQVWTADQGTLVAQAQLPEGLTDLSFKPGTGEVVASAPEKAGRALEIATGRVAELAPVAVVAAPSGEVSRFVEADAYRVSSHATKRGARIVSVRPGDRVVILNSGGRLLRRLSGYRGRPTALALSGEGDRVIMATHEGGLGLWQMTTSAPVWLLPGEGAPIKALAWSRDGAKIATMTEDGNLRIRNSESGLVVSRPLLEGQTREPLTMVFTPDGSKLFVGYRDGRVQEHDGVSGELKQVYEAGHGWIGELAVSPDGRWLAVGARDGTIAVREVRTGKLVRELQAHRQAVTSVAFNASGSLLLTGSWDQRVIAWNVASGEPLKTLEVRNAGVKSAHFVSENSRRVVVTSVDQSVVTYDLGVQFGGE